jgi:hypothetical protein
MRAESTEGGSGRKEIPTENSPRKAPTKGNQKSVLSSLSISWWGKGKRVSVLKAPNRLLITTPHP